MRMVVSRELPCSSKEITSLFVGYPESDLTSVSPQSVVISPSAVSEARSGKRDTRSTHGRRASPIRGCLLRESAIAPQGMTDQGLECRAAVLSGDQAEAVKS